MEILPSNRVKSDVWRMTPPWKRIGFTFVLFLLLFSSSSSSFALIALDHQMSMETGSVFSEPQLVNPIEPATQAIVAEQAEPVEPPAEVEAAAACTGRCRVRIVNNTVVADNGHLLRGDHILAFRRNWGPSHSLINKDYGENHEAWIDVGETRNIAYYRRLRDRYNLNTIRLLVYRDIRRRYPENWYTTGEVLPVIDNAVRITQMLNMYLIIDYHPVPPGRENWSTQSPKATDTYLPNNFTNFAEDSKTFWAQVGPRYKGYTHVLYELHNEPNHWTAGHPQRYEQGAVRYMEQLYQQVRAAAPNTHLILWSFAGRTKEPHPASDMRDIVALGKLISYSNATVGFHGYGNDKDAILLLRNRYPSFMTEYTVLNIDPRTLTAEFAKRINWYEENKISWVMLNLDWDMRQYNKTMNVTWPKDPATTNNTTADLLVTPDAVESAPVLTATLPLTLTDLADVHSPESDPALIGDELEATEGLAETVSEPDNQVFKLYLPTVMKQ